MTISITYTCDVCGREDHPILGNFTIPTSQWDVPEDWREICTREGRRSYPMYHVCSSPKCQETVSKGITDFFNGLATKRFSKKEASK